MLVKVPEHCKMSLDISYFPAPLRVTMMMGNSPEHWNMFPAFLLFPFPVPLCFVTTVTTFQRHFNTLAANSKFKSQNKKL